MTAVDSTTDLFEIFGDNNLFTKVISVGPFYIN